MFSLDNLDQKIIFMFLTVLVLITDILGIKEIITTVIQVQIILSCLEPWLEFKCLAFLRQQGEKYSHFSKIRFLIDKRPNETLFG